MAANQAEQAVDLEALDRARRAGEGVVRRTPVLTSRTLGERCGGTIVLKAENLQRTGSFKLRGALAFLDALRGDDLRGVVTGSAGNHAQALAYAARARGVPCEVFMPVHAPIAKAEAAAQFGATVRLEGRSVEEALRLARRRGEAQGMAFVHPYDDPRIVAGQATLGLDLVEEIDDLARVIVPLGGGGLVSGIALAVKSARPAVEVVGVRAETCAPHVDRPAGEPSLGTLADGIAVKRPGRLTGALIERWVDDVVAVGEDAIATAMALLLERAKLVVEGAGAVGVAALLSERIAPAATGTTAVVLSGGNVDAGTLSAVARRHETERGRRLVLMTRVPDRPGELARLLERVAGTGANLVDVAHVREGLELHVGQSAVELVLQTRGRDHAQAVLRALVEGGYEARVLR